MQQQITFIFVVWIVLMKCFIGINLNWNCYVQFLPHSNFFFFLDYTKNFWVLTFRQIFSKLTFIHKIVKMFIILKKNYMPSKAVLIDWLIINFIIEKKKNLISHLYNSRKKRKTLNMIYFFPHYNHVFSFLLN